MTQISPRLSQLSIDITLREKRPNTDQKNLCICEISRSVNNIYMEKHILYIEFDK